MAKMIADRRLYLTADEQRVVEHGDPDAAFLLCGEGCEVPSREAERLGLTMEDGVVVYPGSEDGQDEDAEADAEEAAGEDQEPPEEAALEGAVEAPGLPFEPEDVTVADLPEALAGVDDVETVHELQRVDGRTTAAAHYERRVDELSE